jgi:D-serine deaminase-like pyridoxal phosphate-dependent protein
MAPYSIAGDLIGVAKQDLDTPRLCIDLDALESNITRMGSICRARGVQWRPHAKCHKCPTIAHKELAAGAIGVTVAKLSEAEVMADSGVRDILVANMVVGPIKWKRAAALCRHADPIIACDHFAQVEPLSRVCAAAGVRPRVVIEIDIGFDRVGVRPGAEALQLAQAIDRLPGVRLVGVMGWEGHLLQIEDAGEKTRRIGDSLSLLVQTRDAFQRHGLNCEIVSAGGSGSFDVTTQYAGVTEVQAGGAIFADPHYQLRCGLDGFRYALSVLATCVSRPLLDRAVLDSGRKTVNPDPMPPLVAGWPDATVRRTTAEHMELDLGPGSRDMKIGDKVELVVGYADFTTILHDEFVVVRNGRVECVWPVTGRGMLR